MNWYKIAQAKESLYIHFPDGTHGWGICLWSEDQEKIKNLIDYCMRSMLDKKLKYFWQSGSKPDEKGNYPDFQFFEFFTNDEDLVLKECEKVADYMGMSLS